jgi:phage minor structural protein
VERFSRNDFGLTRAHFWALFNCKKGGDTLIKILNQQLQPVAILENAYSIGYEKSFNALWTANFSLPLNDEKNAECQSLYFVEVTDNDDYIGLFRIIPSNTVKSESTNEVKYQCEHVLSTLLDDVLFLYHQNDNLTTRDNLQYVIDNQTTKRWKLGTVGMTRYFSYKWENENLLSALFSIPKTFDVPYQWTYDTQSYPWILNLVEPESEVTCEIRYGKNQKSIEREVDPTVIFNRIYALGYGEGDNQLTIKSVNGGIPYVEDAESIAKYGLRSYIWVDKRFESPETLKANAQALLSQWKVPKVTYKASAADISSITGEDVDKLKMGRIVRMVDDDLGTIEARIMKESKGDLTGNPGDISLEIANKVEDLSTTNADLERRQQINELYSQGATNIDSHDYNDNADPDNPAEITFYLPDELVKINKLLLSFKTDKFRAYERAIEGGGAVVSTTSSGGGSTQTSSSGGGSTQTSSSGGGVSTSTSSGGGTSQTSSAGGDHSHLMFSAFAGPVEVVSNRGFYGKTSGGTDYTFQLPATNGADVYTYSSSGNHTHSVTVPNHAHDFNVPNHSHSVGIPNHTHDVSIPNHSHDITLPNHTHAIQFGIYKLDNLPSAVVIKVDGNTVPFTDTSGDNIDLIPYLSKDGDGKVNRGWHTITVAPDDLGRINAQIFTQFFIQSRGGGSF